MRKKFLLDKFILELKNFRDSFFKFCPFNLIRLLQSTEIMYGTIGLNTITKNNCPLSAVISYGWKYLYYSCPFHAFIVGIPETNTKTKQSISQELCICLLKRKTIPYAVLQTKHSWKNPKCTIIILNHHSSSVVDEYFYRHHFRVL